MQCSNSVVRDRAVNPPNTGIVLLRPNPTHPDPRQWPAVYRTCFPGVSLIVFLCLPCTEQLLDSGEAEKSDLVTLPHRGIPEVVPE